MSPGLFGRLVVGMVLVVGLLAPATRALADADAPAGPALIIDPASGEPSRGGGSETAFSVRLPNGAACQGDSLNDYRVQSFVVPATVDPGTLLYQGVRPGEKDGSARYWALYETNSTTYMNRPTDLAVEEGGEGMIINIPSFDYAVFDPGMVPTGRARLGIACSLFGETTRYWSTEIDIVGDADDPAGIAWSVLDVPADPSQDSGSGAGLAAAGAGAALVVGVALVRRRSTTRRGVS